MSLVSLSHLAMHHGGPLFFEDLTINIHKGSKVGIIGPNGAGKTTLLNLIAGRLEPTAGQIFRQKGLRVVLQEQELSYQPGTRVFDEMRTVFSDDLERAEELKRLEEKLSSELPDEKLNTLLQEYQRLQNAHEAAGAYGLDQRIANVLSGLGLAEETWEQEIERFSGGERNIISLAKIILQDPDLILFDEPSNHLDFMALEWFIRFVRKSEVAIVMVSHDRHLLDATVKSIWELKNKKVNEWSGNYSDYQNQREKADALLARRYKEQERTIKRLNFQARRLMDMANAYDDPGQAKRAKNMLRRIEEMEKVERPQNQTKGFSVNLKQARRHGRIALQVHNFSFAYNDKASQESSEHQAETQRKIFEEASLEIEYGERVALVGPNGSGKTTLFKQILAHASWDNQQLRLGKSVQVGDYSQFHDLLDHNASLIDWCVKQTTLPQKDASLLLHRYLFSRQDLERKVSTLSGGEKSRLQLIRLTHGQVNFLLLDEPTNHLDLKACEELEETLEEFKGTLLIISHDRFFLEKLVTRVVEIEDHKLQSFDGTFHEWLQAQNSKPQKGKQALELYSRKSSADKEKATSLIQRQAEKEKRRWLRKCNAELRRLEERIKKHEDQEAKLHQKLEELYNQGELSSDQRINADQHLQALKELQKQIADLYNAWEKLEEQREEQSRKS